jgi:hypothetical protein
MVSPLCISRSALTRRQERRKWLPAAVIAKKQSGRKLLLLRQKSAHPGAGNTDAVGPYLLRFEAERFYRGWRHHWVICARYNPEELVSWGHAPTRELAELAAQNAVERLEAARPHHSRSDRIGGPH